MQTALRFAAGKGYTTQSNQKGVNFVQSQHPDFTREIIYRYVNGTPTGDASAAENLSSEVNAIASKPLPTPQPTKPKVEKPKSPPPTLTPYMQFLASPEALQPAEITSHEQICAATMAQAMLRNAHGDHIPLTPEHTLEGSDSEGELEESEEGEISPGGTPEPHPLGDAPADPTPAPSPAPNNDDTLELYAQASPVPSHLPLRTPRSPRRRPCSTRRWL